MAHNQVFCVKWCIILVSKNVSLLHDYLTIIRHYHRGVVNILDALTTQSAKSLLLHMVFKGRYHSNWGSVCVFLCTFVYITETKCNP